VRSLREGEQHTRGDRVHTARDGEEPAVQFGTCLLVRLQQHPGRQRHQHHSHHEEKASEDGDYPEDDHPYTVWSASTLGSGFSEDPLLILRSAFLKQSTSQAAGMCQSR
jgi:hypothetical protein